MRGRSGVRSQAAATAVVTVAAGLAIGCGNEGGEGGSLGGDRAQQHYLRSFITKNFEREDRNSNGFMSR